MKLNFRVGSSLIAAMFLTIFSNTILASTLNFDGTGAPSYFAGTSPLTNVYSSFGVNFSGVDGLGGSILNQNGGFGFNALSGTDFLAFNTSVGTGEIERITFDSAVSSVSIWAASSFSGPTSISAFNLNGYLLSSSVLSTTSTEWQQLMVSGIGIMYVDLVSGNHDGAYDNLVFDGAYGNLDFNVSSVPVPAALPLMASALGIFGIARRRNKSKTA